MSESTEKTTKVRSNKQRIYVTTNAAGEIVARHQATSSVQAQSFYARSLVTREATDAEIFQMAKAGVVIGGLTDAEEPGTLGQDALFEDQGRAHDPGVGIQDQDHASASGRTDRVRDPNDPATW